MKRLLALLAMVIFLLTGTAYAVSVEQASKEQRKLVQMALGDQYPISKIVVVKSQKHGNAYYLGAIFRAKGCGNLVGIWLIGGPKHKPSLLYSVDGIAHQFSGMRKASKTKAAAYVFDSEAKLLKKYLCK